MQLYRCSLMGLVSFWLLANSLLALTQEVYVWQRQFSPAVYQAIEAVRSDASGIAILAAEISWDKKHPRLFRSSVDYVALANAGGQVGLVLRIGPYAGSFSADDATARYLTGVASALLKSARAGGLEPLELQVDFDCASSKLAGYRLWLEALRIAVAPTKITFTALPDWLGRDDFPALAFSVDGYILQVHSLEKPTGIEGVFQLCDSDRAWAWIERAAGVGVPFRVALPTYGYRLAFDAAGQFIALAAESTMPAWPTGTKIRTVRADALTMAKLAQKLVEMKPTECTGIIWFRLPVAGDQLNWRMSTLRLVLRGGLPVSRLAVEVNWTSAGLAELSLVNRGERDEVPLQEVRVQWADDGRVLTGDGLHGYSLLSDRTNPRAIALSAARGLTEERIAPGRSRKIGWIRFSHETSLITQFIASH